MRRVVVLFAVFLAVAGLLAGCKSVSRGVGVSRGVEVPAALTTPPPLPSPAAPMTVGDGLPEMQAAPLQDLGGTAAGLVPREKGEAPRYSRTYVPPTTPPGTEAYAPIDESGFHRAMAEPLSTFSVDVDTASYANVRRFLVDGMLPPRDAVRIEEMINYFLYDYPDPNGEEPFSIYTEVSECPWAPQHRLVQIGLRGKDVKLSQRPPSNLVFLIDVSGSMQPADKLPLLKRAMELLVKELDERDRVAMVVYAGSSGLVLPSTQCDREGKSRVRDALRRLEAGGSTHGSAGIQQAYEEARRNFIEGGTNRVILATDGDFNVGITSQEELERLMVDQARSGIFLTVLGFGTGNIKDTTMETLADKGNGNYGYVDGIREARKLLVEQMAGTLLTIAKDVKIQVEFNPARVQAYRLVGYENRLLAAEDFNDDTKDAGEIGAGHRVTALYEVVPVGVEFTNGPSVDPLKYQRPAESAQEPPAMELTEAAHSNELLLVKLRYKEPDGDTSRLITKTLTDDGRSFERASRDLRFAASVAAFGMLLRNSDYRGDLSFDDVVAWADSARGFDPDGYRSEFVQLVKSARDAGG